MGPGEAAGPQGFYPAQPLYGLIQRRIANGVDFHLKTPAMGLFHGGHQGAILVVQDPRRGGSVGVRPGKGRRATAKGTIQEKLEAPEAHPVVPQATEKARWGHIIRIEHHP